MPNVEHEQTLNVWLAELLRQRGIDARQERKQAKGGRIDVEIRIGTVKIALEAKQGQKSNNQRDAITSADSRLTSTNVDCAIALCYPEGIADKCTLTERQLMWTIRNPDALVQGGVARWSSSDLNDLARTIKQAPMQLGNPDKAAAGLSASLDAAVERMSETQKAEVARAIDLPKGKLTRVLASRASHWNQAAKRAMLVLATAVMFHSRLDSHRNELKPQMDNRQTPPIPFTSEWPPSMAHQCLQSDDPISEFYNAWDLWLAVDYKPIFATAQTALHGCPHDHAFTEAIRETAEAALAMTRDITGLRHDLLGRIFHTVLDTAKYDGSYYTSTPAATMLASLAITNETCDFASTDKISRLRVTDPACGTGTLLMTAGERIRELAQGYGQPLEMNQILIEQVLRGYDVNLSATHMAATTLGLLSPTTAFKNMKIGRAMLGVDQDGNAYLGSLEFLSNSGVPRLLSWPSTVTQIDSEDEMDTAEPSDVIIMNPPFTADRLRHDQFTEEDEAKLKQRERALFANTPTYMAGQSGAFLLLGDSICKKDKGTLAAVIPLSAATDASGLGIRRHLASHFHIETIIASQDPERSYFSENTKIGEALIICRRYSDEKKPPTQIINLARNPSTPAEALLVAQIIDNKQIQEHGYGTVQQWPSDWIETGNWNGVQFLQPYLSRQFAALRNSELFPTVQLNSIAEIGPAGQRIRDAFTKSPMPDYLARTALWHHKTNVTKSIEAIADTNITAKPDKVHLAEKYWNQRSRLLLPTRIRLNTVRALTVRLDEPTVGSAWTPCRIKPCEQNTEKIEKALAVYLNSSIGILALAATRTSKDISYPSFSLTDLRGLTVPDFSTMSPHSLDALAKAYDSQAHKTLDTLPMMTECEVRGNLDATICDALDLDEERVRTIRRILASEPAITAKRYAI